MGSPDRPSSPTDDSGSTLTSTGTSAGSTAVMSALEELPPGRWSIRRSLGVRRSLGIMRRRGSPAARRHASYDAPTSGVAERFVAELRARRAERLARERRQAQDGALVHNEAHGWDWLVVHPHSRRMALFDLLVFFCVSVTAVSLPLEVGFSIVATAPLRIVDVIMSTVFLIDVALQFVHGSMHRGYPELRLRRIARRYLRTYFVPDLLASLPYGLMGTSPALQAIGMVRVLRILRFRRLTHQLKKLPLLGAVMRSPFTRVAVTVLVWVYICHFYGCMWCAPPPTHPSPPLPTKRASPGISRQHSNKHRPSHARRPSRSHPAFPRSHIPLISTPHPSPLTHLPYLQAPRGLALSLPRRAPLPRRHLAHRLLLRRRRR